MRNPSAGAPAAVAVALVLGLGLAAVPVAPVAADGSGALTVDHDGGAVTVANGSSQVVSGTADFREGTELVVRVRSSGGSPFLKSSNAVVTANGTWAVAFDFSRQSAGANFSLTVMTENDSHSTSVEGEVVACGGNCSEEPPRNTPTPRPEQTATTTTSDTTPAVALDDAAVLVPRGDVAAVELLFRGSEAATLALGGANATGEFVVSVTDTNDDGRATLFLDTAMAGSGEGAVSVSGEDTVAVRSGSLPSSLGVGDYPLDVYAGEGTDGRPETVATLVVQSSGNDTATAATDGQDAAGPALPGGLAPVAVSGAFLLAGAGVALVLLRR